MKNVLIISYSFPPLNNIAARRYGEMVYYMEQFGWRPYIITTQSEGALPLYIDEQQCLRFGSYPQNDGINKNIEINKLSNTFENVRRILGRLDVRFRSIDRTVLTWANIVKKETDMILDKFPKMDLVIASYGPAASIWLGRWFAGQYDIPWIIDYRDLAALRRDNRTWIAYKIDCIMERQLLKNCAGIITVSDYLSNILKDTYSRPCEAIYNGWTKKIHEISNDNQKTTKNYIYYAGQFYEHRMEAVYCLLKALNLVGFVQLKIRSLGPSKLEKEIISYANNIGITEMIELLPPANPDIIEKESQQAMMNIVFEDMNEKNKWAAGTLTGKFLQLLPGDVPIMSIARSDNEMGRILEKTGRGRLCYNVKQIKDFLTEAKSSTELFVGNTDIISEFSKKKQAEKLCKFLEVISNNGHKNKK